jgi:hypothetical protein
MVEWDQLAVAEVVRIWVESTLPAVRILVLERCHLDLFSSGNSTLGRGKVIDMVEGITAANSSQKVRNQVVESSLQEFLSSRSSIRESSEVIGRSFYWGPSFRQGSILERSMLKRENHRASGFGDEQ